MKVLSAFAGVINSILFVNMNAPVVCFHQQAKRCACWLLVGYATCLPCIRNNGYSGFWADAANNGADCCV